jgi:hypothetical protein
MAQGKRAARRARALQGVNEKPAVLRPAAFDGFIVEPGEGRGTRLCFMRGRDSKDTTIAFGTPDGPTRIILSDVAVKAVAKQLNALVKL